MKQNLLLGTMALLAGSLIAAESGSKENVISAAKKLAATSNYSWKSTVESPGGGARMGGPSEGKTEKDGFTCLSMTRGDNTMEAFMKGEKGALKTADGWQSFAEATESGGDQPSPGRFIARMLQSFKVPAAQAEDLAGKAKELKKDGEAYVGDLTEDGAKSQLSFGGRGGANAPEISGAQGSVKFWLKDGVLAKYELKVKGTISFNGNDREVDRTTTVEIKDIGTTKIEVPEEAKKKMS